MTSNHSENRSNKAISLYHMGELCRRIKKIQIHQISHYARFITSRSVTSLQGPSPRHCARVTPLLSKKGCNGGELLQQCVSDLTFPRFHLRLPASEMAKYVPLDQLAE